MSSLETDLLAELIGAKRACLVALRDLGRRQLDLIDRGDMTGLLDLLATKQRSLEKLQRIQRRLTPFRDQDPDQRCWRMPEDRRRCAEQLQECERLLGEIVSQEKISQCALIRRRNETATRLQGAHLAGKARGAYTAQPRSKAHQLDLFSET